MSLGQRTSDEHLYNLKQRGRFASVEARTQEALEGALAEGTLFLILDSPGLLFRPCFRLTLISTVKRRESTPNEVPVQRHSPQVPPPAPKFELYYGARRVT